MEVYPPKMDGTPHHEIQFDVNVANGVAVDVAKEVLLFWWNDVYPYCVNQSESLLHAEIE